MIKNEKNRIIKKSGCREVKVTLASDPSKSIIKKYIKATTNVGLSDKKKNYKPKTVYWVENDYVVINNKGYNVKDRGTDSERYIRIQYGVLKGRDNVVRNTEKRVVLYPNYNNSKDK